MKTIRWFFLLIVWGACTQKYNAPYHLPLSNGPLVVEGYINVGTGPTTITLSRATSLDSPAVITLAGALVSVEMEDGTIIPLSDQGDGQYTISQIPVNLAEQYRLRIGTPDGKAYASDFSSPIVTPTIDSVSWKLASDGVNIYVSTHDISNDTGYYRWQYEETWEYTSGYPSSYEYAGGGMVISRPDSDMIFKCWSSFTSSDILIGTSATLGSDIIYEFPITPVLFSTQKLVLKYSILVKQYEISQDWYNWDMVIKKNTEQLGSIFDAQPSQVSGNIHCISNPEELVIGFIACTTETEKRIFIDRSTQLPQSQVILSGYEDCIIDTVSDDPTKLAAVFDGGSYIPVGCEPPFCAGFLYSTADCVDCRLKGGTLTKPPTGHDQCFDCPCYLPAIQNPVYPGRHFHSISPNTRANSPMRLKQVPNSL